MGKYTYGRGPSFCLGFCPVIYPCGSVFLVQDFMPMIATMLVLVRVCVCVCVSMALTRTVFVFVI